MKNKRNILIAISLILGLFLSVYESKSKVSILSKNIVALTGTPEDQKYKLHECYYVSHTRVYSTGLVCADGTDMEFKADISYSKIWNYLHTVFSTYNRPSGTYGCPTHTGHTQLLPMESGFCWYMVD